MDSPPNISQFYRSFFFSFDLIEAVSFQSIVSTIDIPLTILVIYQETLIMSMATMVSIYFSI